MGGVLLSWTLEGPEILKSIVELVVLFDVELLSL